MTFYQKTLLKVFSLGKLVLKLQKKREISSGEFDMKIMLHSAIERKGVNMIRRGSQIRSEWSE